MTAETATNYYGKPIVREPGTPTQVYRIATTFAIDHWERACGWNDVVIKVTKKGVTVEMDSDGYSDMLSDAEYYWEMRDEMSLDSLCQSAKRVMDALVKAGPPEVSE